jgi:hypothetical protein
MEVESGNRFSSITNGTTNKSDLGIFSGISNLHIRFCVQMVPPFTWTQILPYVCFQVCLMFYVLWIIHLLGSKFATLYANREGKCYCLYGAYEWSTVNRPYKRGRCQCVAVSRGSAHACFVWWKEMYSLEKQKQNKIVSVCSAPCRQFWTHGHLAS